MGIAKVKVTPPPSKGGMIQKKRLHYIDRAKAIAMICVVFGHVNLFDYFGFGDNLNICKVCSITGIFQVPLFIFLSGLVVTTKKRNINEVASQIYQKFRTLLVPLIIVGGFCIYMCMGRMPWEIFKSGAFIGYWYLWCLFVYYMLHYLYEWLCPAKNKMKANIIFDAGWLVGWSVALRLLMQSIPDSDFLSFSFIANLYPYFLLGVYVKKYNLSERLFANKYTYAAALVLALLFIATKANDFTYPLAYQSFSISVILLVLSLFRQLESASNRVLAFLDWVGQNTLDVYIFHYFVVYSFKNMWVGEWLLNGHYSPIVELVLTGVPAILFTILSIYIGKFIRFSPSINKLVFYK